jgi:hypothetical protein
MHVIRYRTLICPASYFLMAIESQPQSLDFQDFILLRTTDSA